MRNIFLSSLISAALVCAASSFGHARTLENPTFRDLGVIMRHLNSNPPDYDEIVRGHKDYEAADEFDRQAVYKHLLQEHEDYYASLADADSYTLSFDGWLNDYDSDLGAFILDRLETGITISPDRRGYQPEARFSRYSLVFDNGWDIYQWKLPVEAAKKVRAIEQRRGITYLVKLRSLGVDLRMYGANQRVQIVGAVATAKATGDVLWSYSMDPAQYRSLYKGKTPALPTIKDRKVEWLGLRPGMSRKQVAKRMKKRKRHWQPDYSHLENFPRAAVEYYAETAESASAFYEGNGGKKGKPFRNAWDTDRPTASIFGMKLDCFQPAEKSGCEVTSFDKEERLAAFATLEYRSGQTPTKILQELEDKFGPYGDRYPVRSGKRHTRQYVWGKPAEKFTKGIEISDMVDGLHWPVEALIVPQDEGSLLIVQITAAQLK